MAKRDRLNRDDEIALINSLANMSMQEAQCIRDNILDNLTFEMPVLFNSKEEYLAKLEEMLDKESEAERLAAETIGEGDIEFEFLERLAIYCVVRMRVPKTHQ